MGYTTKFILVLALGKDYMEQIEQEFVQSLIY